MPRELPLRKCSVCWTIDGGFWVQKRFCIINYKKVNLINAIRDATLLPSGYQYGYYTVKCSVT